MKKWCSLILLFLFVQTHGQFDSLGYYMSSTINDTLKYRQIERLIPGESNFELRIKCCDTLLAIAKRAGRRDLIAWTHFETGTTYYDYSKYNKAMSLFYLALPIAEEMNLQRLQSKLYNYMGIIASDQGNSKKAVYYFRKTYDIAVKLNDVNQQFVSANNLGVDYNNMESPVMALHYLSIAEKITRKYKAYHLLPSISGNKMECYLNLNDLKSAKAQLDSLHKFAAMDSSGTNHDISANYFSGQYYSKMGEFAKAAKFHESNLKIIPKEDAQEFRKNYKELNFCYFQMKDYKSAYEALQMYHAYSDSIANAENVRMTSEKENEYKSFKTEKELEIQKLSNVNQSLKLKRNRIAVILTSVILVLAVVGFAFVFKLFNDKRKANTVLEKQNVEINQQKKEILDSINYSKRIQDGILPSHEELVEKAGEHFVYYQSKDIVSGDFYWATKRENGKFIMACCDSTGHGVPGAFMSLLGYSLLTKSEEGDNTRTPADILNYVNEEMPKVFKNETRGEQIKDGMDVSICEIDRANLNLKVSGANNSIYHITDDVLHVIKAQKHAVSAMVDNDGFMFANKEVKLKKGDMIVMFTDGFADQFGGPKGKKFKYKQLEDILLANWQKPLGEQRQILSDAFNNWKGQLEQIDDVCIIGIRI
ncbi:MAG TPA: SpoIIE family protein phosphatase [Bacteroidia bacterium]|nr:SpoIIE family protein phosphatase [Bacteroidia bacterium]